MHIGLVLADEICFTAAAAEQVRLSSTKCSDHKSNGNMLLLERGLISVTCWEAHDAEYAI